MAISAARWYTAAAPSTSAATESGSRTSPGRTSTSPMVSASSASSQPHDDRNSYWTMARTRRPRATSASTRWEPMKPSAPLTATSSATTADPASDLVVEREAEHAERTRHHGREGDDRGAERHDVECGVVRGQAECVQQCEPEP